MLPSRRKQTFHQIIAGEFIAAAVLFEIILHQIVIRELVRTQRIGSLHCRGPSASRNHSPCRLLVGGSRRQKSRKNMEIETMSAKVLPALIVGLLAWELPRWHPLWSGACSLTIGPPPITVPRLKTPPMPPTVSPIPTGERCSTTSRRTKASSLIGGRQRLSVSFLAKQQPHIGAAVVHAHPYPC